MRYFFDPSDSTDDTCSKQEFIFHSKKQIQHNMWSFQIETFPEKKVTTYFLRTFAKKLFISYDRVLWKTIPSLVDFRKFVMNGHSWSVSRGHRPSTLHKTDGNDLVTQMPGKIVKILVKEGEEIEQGTPLLILEAMKMENEIKSQKKGVVNKIYVEENDTVESAVLLMDVRPVS